MKKEDLILVRLEKELKEKIQKKSESKGLGLSGYVRMILIESLKS